MNCLRPIPALGSMRNLLLELPPRRAHASGGFLPLSVNVAQVNSPVCPVFARAKAEGRSLSKGWLLGSHSPSAAGPCPSLPRKSSGGAPFRTPAKMQGDTASPTLDQSAALRLRASAFRRRPACYLPRAAAPLAGAACPGACVGA